MTIRIATLAAVLLISPLALAADEETKRVTGRIVDEAGRPAAGVEVGPVWGANGLRWEQVAAIRKKNPEGLWQDEGTMQPVGRPVATTAADGTFSIAIHPREFALLAFDESRVRGALIRLDAEGVGRAGRGPVAADGPRERDGPDGRPEGSRSRGPALT